MIAFTHEDANRAYDEWGCNCGPGALAAIMNMTLDEVRPHIPGFDQKRYTNPTMMNEALRSIGRPWWKIESPPTYGLCRVQWEGPWTEPGVPMRARYRHTHWIAIQNPRHASMLNQIHREAGIFDINAMNVGGWIAYSDWATILVPWLLKEVAPRASGRWHITHNIEVERPTPVEAKAS